MHRGIALTLIAAASLTGGCGARTGAHVPSGDTTTSDASLPDGGPEVPDAGRRPGGGTFTPSAPTRLAAGTHHTCAVVDGGRVRCWGQNASGQLGVPHDGRGDIYPPIEVPGIDDAVEVTAGSGSSCARHESGAVSCWGSGGPTAGDVGPWRVAGLANAVELTSGNFHNCARLRDSSVVCWGNNDQGQLGDGTTTTHARPTAVAGLPDADEITAGWDHSCARAGGAVYCWGHNDDGQLGDGTFDLQLTPVRVAADLGAVEIAAGWSHTCARTRDGEVYCWGRRWGDDITSPDALHALLPTLVEGAEDVVEVDSGGAHTCVRDGAGVVECWGRNRNGQLGDGTASRAGDRVDPAPVRALNRVEEIVAGWVHNCARERSGRVLCWGSSGGWGRGGAGEVGPRVVDGL